MTGATKGYRIAVSEMDRWMEASQRTLFDFVDAAAI